MDYAYHNDKEGRKEKHSSNKTGLFRHNAEYKVRLLFRQEAAVALNSVQEALSPESSGTDCRHGLNDVPAGIAWVAVWVHKDDKAHHLVRLKNLSRHSSKHKRNHQNSKNNGNPVIVALFEYNLSQCSNYGDNCSTEDHQYAEFCIGYYGNKSDRPL